MKEKQNKSLEKKESKSAEEKESKKSCSQYSISVNSGEKLNFNVIPEPKKLAKSNKVLSVTDKYLEETYKLKTSTEAPKHMRQQLQFDINIDHFYEISDTETIRKPIIIDRTSTHPKSAPISKSPSIPIGISSKILNHNNNKTLNIIKQELEKNKVVPQKFESVDDLYDSSEEGNENTENTKVTNRLSGEIFSFEEDGSSN